MTEIKNVSPRMSSTDAKSTSVLVVENLQLFALALTIGGQILIGESYILGQGLWLVSNGIAVFRDFFLRRPVADKVKNVCLLGITLSLCAAWAFKLFN